MKVVILAGGFGSRLSEETGLRPKPMVEIGGMPILWHIMKIYSSYGFHDFIVCAGYMQSFIKEWFSNYFLYTSDVTFDFTSGENKIVVNNTQTESWCVTVVDTGLHTQTGGRVKRIREYVGNEPFMLTYGDGVGDVDMDALLTFHKAHNKLATISVYNYEQHKGIVEVSEDGYVEKFREKSQQDTELINIGYMVLEPEVFDYIDGDTISFEKEPMERLVDDRQLAAYTHQGFWQCMDTVREKQQLEKYWESGAAPWAVWRKK
jgi:glucose-1-phosphate cytidylyltransferase